MTPLRIAIPKGRLQGPSLDLFSAAGYEVPGEPELASRSLRFVRGGLEWILVKDGDVPVYVEHGAADAGVAGLDQIEEPSARVERPLALPFGRCRLALIGRQDEPAILEPTRRAVVATKFPRLARRLLGGRAARSEIVTLHGSVELALVLRLADFAVDLVETGETIRANRLAFLETLLEISPWLIVNRESFRIVAGEVRELIRRVTRAAARVGPERIGPDRRRPLTAGGLR